MVGSSLLAPAAATLAPGGCDKMVGTRLQAPAVGLNEFLKIQYKFKDSTFFIDEFRL